jgi:hypothetical protein
MLSLHEIFGVGFKTVDGKNTWNICQKLTITKSDGESKKRRVTSSPFCQAFSSNSRVLPLGAQRPVWAAHTSSDLPFDTRPM